MGSKSGVNADIHLNDGTIVRLKDVYLLGRFVAGTADTGKEITIHFDNIKTTSQVTVPLV